MKTIKQINDDPSTQRIISANTYDALGQLKNKRVGQKKSVDGSLTDEPLENQEYAMNIRGWLKGINWNYPGNSASTSKVDIRNDRWFGMDLSYDWGFGSNQYNGNIAGTRWVSGGDGQQRAYGYSYDAANRITSADFNQLNGSSFDKAAGVDFSVSNLSYDENGNILSMKQKGLKLGGSVVIDDLSYNYSSNSNQLLNVIDGSNDAQTSLGDFRTSANHPLQAKTSSTRDYSYDENGNLKKDLNKDIGDAAIWTE